MCIHSVIPQWKWSNGPPRMNPPGRPVHSLLIYQGGNPPWQGGTLCQPTKVNSSLAGRQRPYLPSVPLWRAGADFTSPPRRIPPWQAGALCNSQESALGSQYRLHRSAKEGSSLARQYILYPPAKKNCDPSNQIYNHFCFPYPSRHKYFKLAYGIRLHLYFWIH
jgi:hypothetical protein